MKRRSGGLTTALAVACLSAGTALAWPAWFKVEAMTCEPWYYNARYEILGVDPWGIGRLLTTVLPYAAAGVGFLLPWLAWHLADVLATRRRVAPRSGRNPN